jgi:hypothetical protein
LTAGRDRRAVLLSAHASGLWLTGFDLASAGAGPRVGLSRSELTTNSMKSERPLILAWDVAR